MGRFFIFEDIQSSLISLYILLRKKYPEKEFVLVRCDYNHNCDIKNQEVLEKEREKFESEVKSAIKALREVDEVLPVCRIAHTPDMLRGKMEIKQDDVFLLDVSLFDNIDAQSDRDFSEYESVKLADRITTVDNVPNTNIRFYTRSSSNTECSDFTRSTEGKWIVPAVRPANFEIKGGGDENDLFLEKLLDGLEDS